MRAAKAYGTLFGIPISLAALGFAINGPDAAWRMGVFGVFVSPYFLLAVMGSDI